MEPRPPGTQRASYIPHSSQPCGPLTSPAAALQAKATTFIMEFVLDTTGCRIARPRGTWHPSAGKTLNSTLRSSGFTWQG